MRKPNGQSGNKNKERRTVSVCVGQGGLYCVTVTCECTAHLGSQCVLHNWVYLDGFYSHVTQWAALHLAGPAAVWRWAGFPHYTSQSCVNLSQNRWWHISANPGEKSPLNVMHTSNGHEKSNLKVWFSSLRKQVKHLSISGLNTSLKLK